MRLNICQCPRISLNFIENIWINCSDYTWPLNMPWWSDMFNRHLKMGQVLDMPGFWIWIDYISQGGTQSWICLTMRLNMPEQFLSMSQYTLMPLNMCEQGWILQNVPEYASQFLNTLSLLRQSSQYPHHLRYLTGFWIGLRY